MTRIDDLIDQLEAGGELVAHAEFSIDREHARLKIRDYQLQDPHAYVLPLAEAAVLKGASSIAFYVGTTGLFLEFDGRPFTVRDLDELYTALLQPGDDDDRRALQQLAIAINAASSLEPRSIEIRTGTARLRHVPGEPEELTELAPPSKRTIVAVKANLGLTNLARRFFGDTVGSLAEERHLRRACRFSEVDITLDGARISQGHELPGELPKTPIEDGDVRGVAGFVQAEPAGLILVRNGIVLEEEPATTDDSFVAVVEHPGLRTDLSRGRVVRNEAYDRARWCAREARESLLLSMHERMERDSRTHRHRRSPMQGLVLRALATDGLERIRVNSVLRLVARSVRWDDCRGGDPVTLADLLEESGRLVYSLQPRPSVDRSIAHVPKLPREDLDPLIRLFGDRLAPIDSEHHESVPARPIRMEPEVPPGDYAALVPFEGQGVQGEMGMRLDDERSELMLIVEGHLLEKCHSGAPIPGLVAALEGEFSLDEDRSRVLFDEPLARGLAEVSLRLPAMFDALAQLGSRRHDDATEAVRSAIRRRLVSYLDLALVTGNSMTKWLSWVGCPAPVALRLIESAGLPTNVGRPSLAVGAVTDSGTAGSLLAQFPLFIDAAGGHRSLRALDRLRTERGQIGFVREALRPEVVEQFDEPPLRLNAKELEVLREIFGRDVLISRW
jgi:hypothetical protein